MKERGRERFGNFSISNKPLEECLFGMEQMDRLNLFIMEHWAYSLKTRTLVLHAMMSHSPARRNFSPSLPFCGDGHQHFKNVSVYRLCTLHWNIHFLQMYVHMHILWWAPDVHTQLLKQTTAFCLSDNLLYSTGSLLLCLCLSVSTSWKDSSQSSSQRHINSKLLKQTLQCQNMETNTTSTEFMLFLACMVRRMGQKSSWPMSLFTVVNFGDVSLDVPSKNNHIFSAIYLKLAANCAIHRWSFPHIF